VGALTTEFSPAEATTGRIGKAWMRAAEVTSLEATARGIELVVMVGPFRVESAVELSSYRIDQLVDALELRPLQQRLTLQRELK
jgi:hypothetical protein